MSSASSSGAGSSALPTAASGPTAAPRLSSTSFGPGFCEYGGTFPDRCECRCYSGYYPNCLPCPGEEPAGPGSSPALSGGAIIGIVVLVLGVVAALVIVVIWYKNKAGRVTYSLDGGYSDSAGDADGWMNPAAARKAKTGGGGLLGQNVSEDSSSTYDWQAYRNTGGLARDAQVGRWSDQ